MSIENLSGERYVVVRDYKTTARRAFWKVLSRPLGKRTAEELRDIHSVLKINKGYRVFIVQV